MILVKKKKTTQLLSQLLRQRCQRWKVYIKLMKTQMLKWWYITQLVYTDTKSDSHVVVEQLCLHRRLTHYKS